MIDLSREYYYLAVHCLSKPAQRRVDQQYGRALNLLCISPIIPDSASHSHQETPGYLVAEVAPSLFFPVGDVQIGIHFFYYSDGDTSLLIGRHRMLSRNSDKPVPDREKICSEHPFDLVPRNQITSFIVGFWAEKYPLQSLAHISKST